MSRVASTAAATRGSFYLHPAVIAVFLMVFAACAISVQKVDIATAYTDPVAKIRAQDESVYVNSVLTMVRDGDWLTPRFLDRLLLYKPPLLIWLAAISVKLVGVSLVAFRLPALLASAFAASLLFLWIRRSRSVEAASACVLLLIANPLWYTFARLCYTDMLFAASAVAAVFTVHRDHLLKRTGHQWLFAACCAAGILTKNIAGLLPFVIWIVFCVLHRMPWRPVFKNALRTGLFVFVLAAPWHLYQAFVHPQWFWADYVEVQLLGFGLRPPVQSSAEPQLWFYWKRLFLTDPVLVGMAAVGFIAVWKNFRKSADALLITCWLGVMTLALAAFGYRNLPYALNLIAPLALMAALYSFGGTWRIAFLSGVLALRLFHSSSDPIPSATDLRNYASQGRTNDLIIVAPDDEFYSATLDLPHVSYLFIDPEGVVERYARHLAYLGVTMRAEQFADVERVSAMYASRLREWGVPSTKPLATAIVARSEEQAIALTQQSAETDFFLPREMLSAVPSETWATHSLVSASNGRVFLLAKREN